MGWSLSWLAVKGQTPEVVQGILGFQGTGVREEVPEADITGVAMPTGWYLIVANRSGHRLIQDGAVRRISAVAEVVTCDVEEHVMVSSATGWNNGLKLWSVVHDTQSGRGHLDAQGELPKIFGQIKDRLEAEQEAAGGNSADVDYIFDIPVELVERLTGFRHDKRIPELGDCPFEVLNTKGNLSEKPSFWDKLFGW